jgi:hypothetical protein
MLRNGWEKRQGEVATALPELDVVFEASITMKNCIEGEDTQVAGKGRRVTVRGPHTSEWHLVSDDFVASPFRRQRAVEPSPSIHELTC